MRYPGYYIIIALALIFIVLVIFPNLTIYHHKVIYKKFRIYSDKKIDDNIFQILDEVEKKLSRSEIYNEKVKYRMYLSSNIKLYATFVPGQKNAFAAAFPIFKNIFVSQTDIKSNKVYRNAKEDNERSLSSVLAHEATHILIEKKIGIRGNRKLATWKKEGYCEYIGGEVAFDLNAGIKMIYNGVNSTSPAFQYLKYRLLVTYLLNEKKYDFEALVNTTINQSQLERELQEYLRKNYRL